MTATGLSLLCMLAMMAPEGAKWDWRAHPLATEVTVIDHHKRDLVEFDEVRHDLLAEKKGGTGLDGDKPWKDKKRTLEQARTQFLDELFDQVKAGLLGLHGKDADATYRKHEPKGTKTPVPSVADLRLIKHFQIILETKAEWARHGVAAVVARLRKDPDLRHLGFTFHEPKFGEK